MGSMLAGDGHSSVTDRLSASDDRVIRPFARLARYWMSASASVPFAVTEIGSRRDLSTALRSS
jgi:hypothetical protein